MPGVLALNITGSANFGVFVPGVTRDYTASLSATATSTATAAELTVRDPSATATGHLVNGTHAAGAAGAGPGDRRGQPGLGVRAGAGERVPAAAAGVPDGRSAAHPMTIGFKQSIAATEPLVTGAYGKTLMFTLSATTP